ncbi:uncharacterized protein CG45076 [Drosophila virilis]|uniref:Uncharacterized protein n=1 Tax=Drosophila virilis TaxID=7244 RepID=A0A0Q9W3L0_DROVI|nr:uncharacterized protein LOC26530999 [Drosophila virilis]KRF79689.1 uncharacterized protein Dvir_GJ26229 [Drosophila virilis]
MRIHSAFLCLLLAMCLLSSITNTIGYRLVKRHHRKRMAWPQNLYADFAAINSAAGREVENQSPLTDPSGNREGAAGGGNEAGGSGCSESNSDRQCDVKKIFTPGDPKQKSSSIAMKAAQDAKAANEAQHAAGQLAAQHIKQELAEKAFQSAKAAEAALTGKQMVVQQLEQEMQEANAVVEEETVSLQNTEANMNAAIEAARAATSQFEALTALHKTIKENLSNIQTVAMGSQQEMTAKVQLLEAARNRLGSLSKQLHSAREDYEKTKQAAYKAACAAVEAKQKASAGTFRQRRSRRTHSYLPLNIHSII